MSSPLPWVKIKTGARPPGICSWAGRNQASLPQGSRLANSAEVDEERVLRVRIGADKRSISADHIYTRSDDVGALMGERVAARTYYFDALRVPRSAAPVGTSIRLHANAENLAEVLSAFQPNRTLYGEYIELVRRVMPTVKYVSVYPAQNNTVEIRLWPVEESTKRDDLTVPLANCGTGVVKYWHFFMWSAEQGLASSLSMNLTAFFIQVLQEPLSQSCANTENINLLSRLILLKYFQHLNLRK
jgi:hypothetical protein